MASINPYLQIPFVTGAPPFANTSNASGYMKAKKTVRKMINGDEVALYPYFNIFLKDIAVHLSNIEMAVMIGELSGIQHDTIALKALLVNMNLLSGSRLADELQKKANENNAPEVSRLLLALKKIIAQVAVHMKRLKE